MFQKMLQSQVEEHNIATGTFTANTNSFSVINCGFKPTLLVLSSRKPTSDYGWDWYIYKDRIYQSYIGKTYEDNTNTFKDFFMLTDNGFKFKAYNGGHTHDFDYVAYK